MSQKCLPFFMLLFAVCAANNSCTKSPSTPPTTVDTTANHPKDASSIDVYIAGDTMIDGYRFAAYWKNDSLKEMPSGRYSYVTCIYVYNNDVYVVVPGPDNYDYWKNGIGITLPDTHGRHSLFSLTIVDGIIYGTGIGNGADYNKVAVYWKNNDNAVYLVPNAVTIHQSLGKAIAVSNGDVYIAGSLDFKAVCWKNGTATQLPMDSKFSDPYSVANSVCVNEDDVYIAGTVVSHNQDMSIATYWKNNKPVSLTKDTGSFASSIAVVGNDVYVAGGIYGTGVSKRAACWKNGKLIMLDSNYSVANAIAVHGSDVYIAGNINDFQATYWKNGVPVSLGRGEANAIFIVDK